MGSKSMATTLRQVMEPGETYSAADLALLTGLSKGQVRMTMASIERSDTRLEADRSTRPMKYQYHSDVEPKPRKEIEMTKVGGASDPDAMMSEAIEFAAKLLRKHGYKVIKP